MRRRASTLPTPFPQMTYDEAIRQYRHRQAGHAAAGAGGCASGVSDDEAWRRCRSIRRCRWWRSRIPKVGELSRKEREDNHPMFDKNKGAKFIDDFKRLAKRLSG